MPYFLFTNQDLLMNGVTTDIPLTSGRGAMWAATELVA